MWAPWCAFFLLFFSIFVQNGLGLNKCTSAAMGLEDLRIEDSQITALSYQKILSVEGKEIETGPKCARLHNSFCAWCAQPVNGQYIQVDLHQESIVTGISTQGFEALSDNYVTSYNISHSRDGHIWSIFPLVMSGNHDSKSVVMHTFIPPICARYIRIHPVAYNNMICLRMELHGCLNFFVLGTTPTTLTGVNYTTPQNVQATAVSTTGQPAIIHSTADKPKVSITTTGWEESLPSQRPTLQTGNATMQMTINADSKKHSSNTWIIALVVGVIVMIICSLVWFICFRKGKCCYHCNLKNGMNGEEEAMESYAFLPPFHLQQPNGSLPEIIETTERDGI